MKDNLARLNLPQMSFYKENFVTEMWDGVKPIQGKHLVIYCEQGCGDVIQFSRYFPLLKEKGCYLTIHCDKSLHKLLLPLVDAVSDKNLAPPEHDFHCLSMSLPLIMPDASISEISGYIRVEEKADLGTDFENCVKIGIAWEGNMAHSDNNFRSCPLKFFKLLEKIPNSKFFMLQPKVNNPDFLQGAEDFPLYSIETDDFYSTAKFINAMDFVVSVDTSILHLAGAMNKKVFGLISAHHDYRWNLPTKWYETLTLIFQKDMDDWESCMESLLSIVLNRPISSQKEKCGDYLSMLFTGGIGDVLALEPFLTEEERKKISRILFATKAAPQINEIFSCIKQEFPKLIYKIPIYEDFSNFHCFHSKNEAARFIEKLPNDWKSVKDWSILSRFPEIERKERVYNRCSLLDYELDDISQFSLPKSYFVIVPDSLNDAPGRAFSVQDWSETIKILEHHQVTGVILRHNEPLNIQSDCLIDLTNKTNVKQSLEITKRCKGYVGIDSFLSVMATKSLSENLYIKSVNSHLYRWKEIYYAPKTEFDFVKPYIKINN